MGPVEAGTSSGRHLALTTALAALLLGAPVAPSRAEPPARLTLVIFNHATEAVRLTIEDSRCLDGVAALDGRLVLIELPRVATSLRIATGGSCAADRSVRLRLSLLDLAGGTVGTVALDGADADVVLSAEGAKRGNVCVQTERAGPASAPVLTARFRPCGS